MLVKEVVRVIDAKECEFNCAKKKLSLAVDLIDIEARNAFTNKTVAFSLIKCTNELNCYRIRDQIIN